MVYVTINENTLEGKRLIAELKKSKSAKIHKHPNETTRKAIEKARAGATKKASSTDDLF